MNIEPATVNDTPFIVDLMIEGGKDGHYPNMTEENRILFLPEFSKMIDRGFYIQKQGSYPTKLYVIKRFEEPIGFAWTYEHEDDMTVIQAVSIKKSFRGKGNGVKLLKAVMADVPSGSFVSATCNTASRQMCDLLTKRGFEINYKLSNPQQTVLIKKPF